MTIDQIYRTYALVWQEKMKSERLRALSVANATAYAFGGMKADEFNKFMDTLYAAKTADIGKSLDEAKSMGLPIEEQ